MRENKKTYGSFLPYHPCLPDNQPNSAQPRVRPLYAGRLENNRVAVAHCERCTPTYTLQSTARSPTPSTIRVHSPAPPIPRAEQRDGLPVRQRWYRLQ